MSGQTYICIKIYGTSKWKKIGFVSHCQFFMSKQKLKVAKFVLL